MKKVLKYYYSKKKYFSIYFLNIPVLKKFYQIFTMYKGYLIKRKQILK